MHPARYPLSDSIVETAPFLVMSTPDSTCRSLNRPVGFQPKNPDFLSAKGRSFRGVEQIVSGVRHADFLAEVRSVAAGRW